MLRVGTSPGGSDVLSDYSVQGLQTNYSFDAQWYNRDLYWSVRANASGAEWSPSRRFRIEQNQPPTSCSSYITNFGFSPETPSNATNISVHATISTSFPNFRAARLRVDGGNPFCEGSSYSYSCSNWETRNLLDGDHTVVLEVDDNIGSSWDSPATCSRTYHLDPRPTPPPSAFNLISPGNGVTLSQTQQITLTWQNSNGANEYQAHLWNGSSVDRYSTWSSGTSWIAGQLSPGTYYWRVTARNAYGTTESTQWTFTIQQSAPNTPTYLSAARISQSQIILSWIDNSDNETGFRLYREGLLIATLGVDENYYEDTGLSCGTGYNYYVVAFNTYESGHSNTASATTMDCTPVDTEKPVVDWAGPVSNEQTHNVSNETVELTVSATDNVGVSRVHYSRWDAVNLVTIDIGDSYSSPYGFLLDCSTLNLNWNEIIAQAYDAAGNVSDRKFIWLYRHAPQPDLLPLAPSGYYAPIVPASIPGTHEPNQLYAGQTTYFDWQFANDGWATAPGTFYVELWVDETRYIRYPQPDFASKQPGGDDDWAITIDTPGWHRVRLIVDSDNTVSESDETNNIWEEWFYWNPSAPMIDDMESQVYEWDATGLWHRVTDSSVYMNRTSGVSSWWYGQEETGDYDTGAVNSGDLTSPPIYLPASEHFYLRFKYWYTTETKSHLWDQRWIQISVDGGAFQDLGQLYDDNMNVWHNSQIIDLGAFSGHTIQVRFHFDTLDAMENAYRGWYIDDLEILTNILPSCADAHEGNNNISNATPISYGETLHADICANGDYDYYRFTAQSGDEITVDIDASTNGSLLDSFITLLDGGGEILSTDDDDGMTRDSKLGYKINTAGTYYIRVRDYWHPSNGGQEYFYSIALFSDPDAPTSASITSPMSEDWINPTSQQITVVASDAGSGISRVEFLWHSADWNNTEWIWLGADTNGANGWSYSLDTSVLGEQRGGAIYVWAFDYAENYLGTGIWDLGIDRTPPTTWMDTSAMYGDAPFRDFHVTWGGTDNISGIVGYDFQVRDGLTGEWDDIDSNTTDTYTRFVGSDGHTYYFQTRARDAAGNVSDYIGGDGQTHFAVQLCDISSDSYETDNSSSTANTLLLGDTQSHNFHSERDADWVKFTVEGGKEYIISTVNTGSHADTELTLYDMDGVTTIQSNDDYDGSNYASMIRWQPAQSGTYYALVNHWDVYGYGCTTPYTVSIEDSTNLTPVITTLAPDRVPNRSEGFTLVINGTNFSPDAIVFWDDNELATSFIGNTQLNVSVPASLLTNPGTIDIVVKNPGFGGITSNIVIFTIEGNKSIFLPLVVR